MRFVTNEALHTITSMLMNIRVSISQCSCFLTASKPTASRTANDAMRAMTLELIPPIQPLHTRFGGVTIVASPRIEMPLEPPTCIAQATDTSLISPNQPEQPNQNAM